MFTFSTTTNQKLIEFEKSGAVVSINVIDGGDEFNPTLADLSSYVTKTADGYYTDGIYAILDNSVSYIFKGFMATAVADINGVQYELNYDSLGAIEYSDAQKSFFVVANGSRVSLYSQLYFDIAGGSSPTVDLYPVMTEIYNQRVVLEDFITSAKNQILAFTPMIDMTPIEASLTTIKGYTDTLEADLQTVKTGVGNISSLVADISLNSLNGNGAEFLDGVQVQVVNSVDGTLLSREAIYTVIRSYHSIYADNAYIVVYDLESLEGHKLSCPESLLVKYNASTLP